MITCSATAFPQPEFQWILLSSGEFLPQSSWISIYETDDKTANSTLMYTFTTLDFNNSSTVVVCRAANAYGASEQFFTLKLKSTSEQFSTVTLNIPSPISASRAPLTPTLHATNGSGNDGGKQATILAIVNGAIAAVAWTILLLIIILLLLKYLLKRKKR